MVTDEEVEERKADREGWTRVKKKDGSKGFVPTNFLKGWIQMLHILNSFSSFNVNN